MNISFRDARKLGLDLNALLGDKAPRTPIALPNEPCASDVRSGPGCWLVTIDHWRPASDNGLHKSVRREIALKRRDEQVIGECLVGLAGCPKATGRREVFLTIVKRRRPLPDPTNLFKSFLDALVRNGVLVNDSADWAYPHTPYVCVDRSLPVSVRTTVHVHDIGPRCTCCPRAEEYNGFGSDGPLLFVCPKGCSCHD